MNRSVIRYLYPFQIVQQFVLFIAFGTVIRQRSSKPCEATYILMQSLAGIVTNIAQDVLDSNYGGMLHTIIGKLVSQLMRWIDPHVTIEQKLGKTAHRK